MPALGPPGALSPRDWNAIVDYDQWRDLFSPDDGVALHHGGSSDYPAGRAPHSQAKEIQQLQQWEGYHIYSKGWRGLAYGWGVGQSGTIYRIRGWATYGAHTGDLDGDGIANNAEIVPIIFVGSGNHHNLSPAAQASIVTLRRFIEEGSPQATQLYGHRELRGTVTSCPGPKGMAYVIAHRELLEDDLPLSDQDLEAISQKVWFNGDMRDYVTGNDLHAATHIRHARRDAFEARVEVAVVRALVEKIAPGGATITHADIDAIASEVADELRDRLLD